MMGDAYRVAKQAYDKKDKTMTTRDAGLTQEPVEAAKVHAAGSSHCGEIKSKSASSRYSTDEKDERTSCRHCYNIDINISIKHSTSCWRDAV
jgi:hypothetical protein